MAITAMNHLSTFILLPALLFHLSGCQLTDVYTGHGVIQHAAGRPMPYISGIIRAQFGAGKHSQTYRRDTVLVRPGWKLEIWFELLDMWPISDEIEVLSHPTKSLYKLSFLSESNYNRTEDRVELLVQGLVHIDISFSHVPQVHRSVRVRWISTPLYLSPQAGFFSPYSETSEANVMSSEANVTCCSSDVNTVLVNVIEDGDSDWTLLTSDKLVALVPGVQYVELGTNSTSFTVRPERTDTTLSPADYLIEWFVCSRKVHMTSDDRTSGSISYISLDSLQSSQEWLIKENNTVYPEAAVEFLVMNISSVTNDIHFKLTVDGRELVNTLGNWNTPCVINIPVHDVASVRLVVSSDSACSVQLTYKPNTSSAELSASGMLSRIASDSSIYPSTLSLPLSGPEMTEEVVPLFPGWYIQLELDEFDVPYLRSWLDLILGMKEKHLVDLQRMTGDRTGYRIRYPAKLDFTSSAADPKLPGHNFTGYASQLTVRHQTMWLPVKTEFTDSYHIRWLVREERLSDSVNITRFHADFGALQSENYPHNYYNDHVYSYDITLQSTELYQYISITFVEVDMDWSSNSLMCVDQCALRNFNAKYFYTRDEPLVLHCTSVKVVFFTDTGGNGKGFYLKWWGMELGQPPSRTTEPWSSHRTLPSTTKKDAEAWNLSPESWIGALSTLLFVLVLAIVGLVVALHRSYHLKKQLADLTPDIQNGSQT